MPDVENQQIITFQFWLQSKIPWKCLLIFKALQNLLPFGPQALWRGGRPCENEVWPRGKLPLYWLWKKQIWEQQQNIWEAFLLQVEVVTKSVEGVVTLHVLWRGGEGRAAGVLVYFSRRHDRELPCTDTHTNTHIQQLVSANHSGAAQVWCGQRTDHAGTLDFLHVAIRGGDFPVAAVELTGSFRRGAAGHFYSENTCRVIKTLKRGGERHGEQRGSYLMR